MPEGVIRRTAPSSGTERSQTCHFWGRNCRIFVHIPQSLVPVIFLLHDTPPDLSFCSAVTIGLGFLPEAKVHQTERLTPAGRSAGLQPKVSKVLALRPLRRDGVTRRRSIRGACALGQTGTSPHVLPRNCSDRCRGQVHSTSAKGGQSAE
jgi:hypothetical protein